MPISCLSKHRPWDGDPVVGRSMPPTVRRDHRARRGAVVAVVAVAMAFDAASAPTAPSGVAVAASNAPRRTMAEAPAPIVHGHVLRRRWVYIQTNFQVTANVGKVNGVLDAAKAAGFNGAIFSDVKFDRLDDGSLIDDYYTNLRAVLDHARMLDMTVLPSTANFGYSSALLWHDPDLAEGLPVKDAPFEVVARPDPDRPSQTIHALVPVDDHVDVANGDFEQLPASGDTFPGWAFQDEPGTATFVDRAVKHGGAASLRMADLGTTNPASGNGRVIQRLTVEPFRYYHLSVWVRTQDFSGGDVRALVLAQNPGRTLQWNPVPVQRTQSWTRFDVTFNTLTHREVLVYLGVWGGGTGTIWWDDASIEPAGFVNAVRRGSTPVRITSGDGQTVFREEDVCSSERPACIGDVFTGRVPYNGVYDLWHAPPIVPVFIGRSAVLHVGDIVRISYHHVALVYGDQVTASLTVPKVFDLLDVMLKSTRREFDAAGAFGGWMFNHDEIRVQGWDESKGFGDGSPGADLAGNVSRLRAMARAIDPAAPVFVWSDMFDPFHNAADTRDPYYLVNGNWSGSWAGLTPDMTVVNWNHGPKARDSAAFFAGRGHRQILAGYYDSSPERFNDRQWLAELEGVPGIDGVMYTQWGSGFGNLAAWAQHVWGGAEWVTPPPEGSPTAGPGPSATPTPGATPAPSVAPVPSDDARTWIYLPRLARQSRP